MKKGIFVILIILSVAVNIVAQTDNARPWTFWYWMYGAVSKAGIKADLQAMKDVGMGGAYLMPIRGAEERPEYKGEARQLSATFWDMTDYALHEADSIGLQMGIHVCDGFALAGGPWITPAESMQKVVFSDTVVSGRDNIVITRPRCYKGYYEDIACYALPVRNSRISAKPAVTYSAGVIRDDRGALRSELPCWIQYGYRSSICCRNIEIVTSGTNIQSQRFKVMASDDGVNFRLVKQLVPPRQGWQNAGYNATFAIQPTCARYFRFEWTPEGTEPGSEDLDAAKWKPTLKVNGIILRGDSRIDQWEGKAGYVWRIAAETTADEVADKDCYEMEDIIRLRLKGDTIATRLPRGEWRVLRMGHTSTGQTNATAGGGRGLECDKFSAGAVDKQIDGWFDGFMKRRDSHVIKYMHVDSWECGSQNWSSNFAAEFNRRRGYDILPYLPVMAGLPIGSAEKSEQVLRDVRSTINDLVNDVFFATVKARADKYGCLLSSESVAPTMVSDGMEHYKYADIPMGEYWLNSPTHDKPNDMLDAISGAHVYGKNIVQAEGFTEIRGVWDETPAMIKPLLDRNFCLGMNKLFFHVNAHNPWIDKRPGMTLDGIGLFFQRDQTWFNEASALVDYVTRCQSLLQYGHPVVDIAVFTGEEMPRRSVLPERLVNLLPGIYGERRVAAEAIRLANNGEPMTESPVGVNHSANIADTRDWVNPMRGYAYDSFNKDALLALAKVEDGSIVLPGGARYRVLVLPDGRPGNPGNVAMSAEVGVAIDKIRRAGVIVPRLPYRECDFSGYGLPRDVELPEYMAYTHRSGADKDLYFISNQEDYARDVKVSFRQKGRKPYIYDAVTDERYCPREWKEVGGRTEVRLSLAANGSLFVVFPVEENDDVDDFRQAGYCQDLKTSPWIVHFEENNITLKSDSLFDWSRHNDDKVRYYSGHVMYSSSFRYDGKHARRTWLDFGRVCDIAHVWINGEDCGIAWTSPYRVEITKALIRGRNEIRIEVVNTWANALRGADNGHPPYYGIWTNAKYRMKGDDLLPAGISGIKMEQ